MPTNQQHSGNGDNIAGDKIVYEFPKLFSEKVLTPLPEKNEVFIGREQESLEIIRKLSESTVPLVIMGVGGIGKTALVNDVFYKNYDTYEKVAYIEIGKDFKSSILNAFSTSEFKSTKEEDMFQELMLKLSSISENVIMIVDNLSKQEDYNLLKKFPPNYKIIVTSRIELSSNTFKIYALSRESAQALFLHYHKVKDIESLDFLLEYLGFHTYFIELTAKVLDSDSSLSISNILEYFYSGELSKLTLIDLDSSNERGLDEYLSKLFDMTGLSLEYINILRKFALLPSVYFHKDLLGNFLADEKINRKLAFLSKKGWILKTKFNFKLHEIIREYVLKNYKPDCEVSKDMIAYFDDIIKGHMHIKPSLLIKSIPFAVNLLLVLEEENFATTMLRHTVSMGLREIGSYSLALLFIKEAIKYSEEELGKTQELSTFYNHLGYVYQNIDLSDKSIVALEKSIKLEKQKDKMDYHILSISYNTLAVTYRIMYHNTRKKQYKKKAKYFIDLAIDIRENKIDNDPVKLGYVYNNASSIYLHFNMKKAIEFAKKAIELREEIYDENHPRLASAYANMGVLLAKNKDYYNAILHYKKSEKILIDNYGKNYPQLYIQYGNLANSYIEIGNREEAEKYIKLGINNAKQTFDSNHSSLNNFELMLSLLNSSTKPQSKKTPRNSKCPCNSGKKFKYCCGKIIKY